MAVEQSHAERPLLEFYEKPGCINNRKQKDLLIAAGFDLEVHNLLCHPWTVGELRMFFRELSLPQWFNPSAPRIKQEKIKPFLLTEDEALKEMVADPLLIRRPLIAHPGKKQAGFDLNVWLPLLQVGNAIAAEIALAAVPANIELCPKLQQTDGGCSQ